MSFIAGKHVRLSYAAGRRQIVKLNRRARDFCPCGQPKSADLLVCLECWKASPQDAKLNLRSLDLTQRRLATHAMVAIANSRRPQN